MKAHSLQRLRGLLQADRTLAVLLPEAERMAGIDRRLRALLPVRMATRCRALALTEGTLVVHCDNGAAASRLRSQAKSLAERLSTTAWPVTAIKVRVRADWGRADRPEKPGLGGQALDALDRFAESLPDGGLKDAVARMAGHQRR